MTLTLFSRTLHYKDSKSEPCVHSISWINRWNLTKLAQIHHWHWGKKWLDFGDLDLIFKVTPALWNSNFDRKKLVCILYLEPIAGILPNWHTYIIRTRKRSDWILVTLTSFSRSLHYKDSKNEPCVHSISWNNRWNLTKLAQIHHLNWEKKWLDFGDLDLIFKVTPAFWNSNFDRKKKLVCTLSLEPMAGILPN